MNKFLTKIAGVVASLAMVIGVGVGVANKQAKGAYAENEIFASTSDTFELASSISAGDQIIIATKNYSKAMSIQGTNLRSTAAITKSQEGNTATVDADDSVVLLTVGTATISNVSYFTFNDGSGYLNNNSQTKSGSNQNYLTTVDSLDTTGGKTHWTVSFSDGVASFVSKGQRVGTGRYTMSYNYNNGNDRISCYQGIQGTGQLAIYKKVNTSNSSISSVTINNAPQSTITGVNVGTEGPVLTASATMRSGEDSPTFTWASDNEEAVKVNALTGALQYVGNGTAHITATASLPAGDEDGDTNVGTVTIVTNNLKGSNANPFTVSEALAVAEATGATATTYNCYTSGIVSRVKTDETFNEDYGSKVFWISADGTANNELEAYHCLYLGGEKMSEAEFNSVEAGDSITIVGKLVTYNSTKEYAQGCYITSHAKPVLPRVSITESSQSINAGETLNLHATVENAVPNYSIVWESGNNNILTVESTGLLTATVTAGNNGGSTTVTAKMLDEDSDVIATSSPITITVRVPLLQNGDTVVFYYGEVYLSNINASNYGNTVNNKASAVVYTVEAGSVDDSYAFVNAGNYLSWTSGNTLIYSNSVSNNSSWMISGDSLTDCVISNAADSDRELQYNTTSPRFACYTGSQKAVSIEKVIAPQVDSVTVAGDSIANANNETSIAKEFDYEVTYVDPNNQGNSSVSVTVLNSSDTTDGASVTTAPSNGIFIVTFTASDTYTVTVTSLENNAKSDSITIVVSNIYVPVLTNYNLFTGSDLIESNYIISYDNSALKASLTSERGDYVDIIPVENVVTTDLSTIVWHIAPAETGYFTIYNADTNKYLASTGAKNKLALISDGTDDNAKWSIAEEDGLFDIVNKKNTANKVNATLRKNGTYGFACYAAETGGKLTLYKRDSMSYLSSFTTEASLLANETNEGVDSVQIKFKTKIAKYAWNELNTNTISEFGVMLFKTRKNSHLTAEEKFDAEVDKNNPVTVLPVNNINYGLTLEDEGDYYSFIVKVAIAGASSYDLKFCVSPYVVIGGTHHFLGNMDPSVNYLAQNGLVESNLSPEALAILAGE